MKVRFAVQGILLLLVVGLMVPSTATDPVSADGGTTIGRATFNGGETLASTEGNYVLVGTAGQADAAISIGGDYALVGGFWSIVKKSSTNPIPVPSISLYGMIVLVVILAIISRRRLGSVVRETST